MDSSEQNVTKINFSSPIDRIDTSDPGDATQRNFRYQHGYGVILLVAAINGNKPYRALWCEQHEDFLAERTDNLYDAFQIKTTTPENGKWDLHDDDLIKSIKRFVGFNNKFKVYANEFFFVSNVDYLISASSEKIPKCPTLFLKHIQEISNTSEVNKTFKSEFDRLIEKCKCTDKELFDVLKKTNLILGPPRDDFDSIIAHTHVALINECSNFNAVQLNKITEELIYKVFDRCAIAVDLPAKHYYCLNKDDDNNPMLIKKKISIDEIIDFIKNQKDIPFIFKKNSDILKLGEGKSNLDIMKRKLIKGGLISQLDIMERRTLSAEENLIKLVYANTSKSKEIINQLENMVKGEYDEVYLKNEGKEEPFGKDMLIELYERLKLLSKDRASMVYNQEYECLIGIAGLLTGECKIKWSKTFNLEEG